MQRITFFILLFNFAFLTAFSQDVRSRNELILLQKMDDAKVAMSEGHYIEADKNLKEVIKGLAVLPAELTYLFGKNSYYLGKYKQSINWLSKYIELKGTSGKDYYDAAQFLEKAEKAYKEGMDSDEPILSPESIEVVRVNSIDCADPNATITCPVCNGEGVIIRQGPLHKTYNPCNYCDETGYMKCEDYNRLLNGNLITK
ncbi:DnaJ-like cysteine-rich domain-containing protein [Mangrovivirga cuniculi]|uniref:zinc finger-like domain-containing protein n=1 Tax=Mangrovivirga cuniculi TaxID=2715131 RepID=UPI0010BF0E91|nr:zinc finger-like domain-containing protein [Mangrovivirga cuniculi]